MPVINLALRSDEAGHVSIAEYLHPPQEDSRSCPARDLRVVTNLYVLDRLSDRCP